MANYSMSAHTLSFSSNYKTLQVCDSTGNVVKPFALNETGKSVSLTVVDDEYLITTGEDFTVPQHKIDAPANAGLSFNGCRLDGIGIVDLRDVNRTGNFTLDYDLVNNLFQMKHVGGSHPLWIQFENGNNCYTYTEI